MNPAARVRLGAFLLGTLVLLGTIAYILVEGAQVSDALYMVLITISTVGYSEVFPLSGAGRVITMLLMLLGVGAAFYTAVGVFELALENIGGQRKQRKMVRDISELKNHRILCGFGRVGSEAWDLMSQHSVPIVVIERDEGRAAEARDVGALVVVGDATRNEILEQAGIHQAKALIACVRNDPDNLVITLSAKALRPGLLVVARATELEAESKLVMAGADRVVAPNRVGAHRLAAMALQPNLSEFFDLVVEGTLVEFRVEQIPVAESCSFAGATLRDAGIREQTGAMILGVEDVSRRLILNPDPSFTILPGQILMAIGTQDQVRALEAIAAGE